MKTFKNFPAEYLITYQGTFSEMGPYITHKKAWEVNFDKPYRMKSPVIISPYECQPHTMYVSFPRIILWENEFDILVVDRKRHRSIWHNTAACARAARTDLVVRIKRQLRRQPRVLAVEQAVVFLSPLITLFTTESRVKYPAESANGVLGLYSNMESPTPIEKS